MVNCSVPLKSWESKGPTPPILFPEEIAGLQELFRDHGVGGVALFPDAEVNQCQLGKSLPKPSKKKSWFLENLVYHFLGNCGWF